MSLVINHNMMAMNAARNLGTVYNQLAVSTQRLSSGLRINSAQDDAAGLAVREFQRSEVAALNQGIRNAGDAISMIQTAEGALQVIDEKLIRMKELAEQAATGTYSSTQRTIMQDEYDAMADEITRIANATDFNGTKLLDGSISASGTKIHFGTGNDSAEDYYYITISGMTSETLGVNVGFASQGAVGTQAAQASQAALTSQASVAARGSLGSLAARASAGSVAAAASRGSIGAVGSRASLASVASQASAASAASQAAVTSQASVASQASTASHAAHGTITSTASTASMASAAAVASQAATGSHGSQAAVTSSASVAPRASLATIASVSTTGSAASVASRASYAAVTAVASQASFASQASAASQAAQASQASLAGYGVTLSTQDGAQNAISTINTAINTKDSARAGLGATANRLENTITNLTIQAENTQAAESRISDVDIATEMTEFTRNQILVQAATAMLAQANSLPQLALQLIGGA